MSMSNNALDPEEEVVEGLLKEAQAANKLSSDPFEDEARQVSLQEELDSMPDDEPAWDEEEETLNEAEEEVNVSFSHIPENSNCYIKIYRINELNRGELEFLMDVYDPENHKDFTTMVQKFAIEQNWGDGTYVLKLIKEGEPGIKATKKIPIRVPRTTSTIDSAGMPSLTETIKNLNQVHELTNKINPSKNAPEQTTPTNPHVMLETLKSAMDMGVKTVKDSIPQKQGMDLPEVLKLVKELQQKPEGPNMVDMISAMSTLMASQQAKPAPPPPSILDQIAKMKELGLVDTGSNKGEGSLLNDLIKYKTLFEQPKAPPQADSSSKAIEMLTALIPLMQGLGGNKEGPSSVGVELIRNIGPQLGSIFGDTMGAIKTAIEAKAGVLQRAEPKRVGGNRVKGNTPPKRKLMSRETLILPVLKPLYRAIQANDATYYPALYQLLLEYIGEQDVAKIITGEITIPDIQAKLAPVSAGAFSTQETAAYFHQFTQWMRAEYQKAVDQEESTPEIPSESKISVVCSKCGANYVLDSLAELDNPDLKCMDCDGIVVLQNKESVEESSDTPEKIIEVLEPEQNDNVVTDILTTEDSEGQDE